ncbi:type II toxin-antitoxin system PemK/MazF family toxin [Litoribacter populi]|uniref:type II toxin-antitoxin system PemK/MazF family toxin n=1 Tax=Litoribacter populi TaxID=2598460 RepID=UPI00117E6B66|nr:type II toxin-antitoxin system PemK/MazF family toxin [Litoribacter populi]
MNRGDIYLINLDPTIGAEIKKTRPCIIISNDDLGKLPLKIIVPITDWKERYSSAPWMVKIIPNQLNSLSKISTADCFQIRSVSQSRLIRKIGAINEDVLEDLKASISIVLQL